MSVTLTKCAFGCKDKAPQDFTRHTEYGESICSWCAGMWIHDEDCSGCKPVSLVKTATPYIRSEDGTIPESALDWRRFIKGPPVSLRQGYRLKTNHLYVLSEFFGGRL